MQLTKIILQILGCVNIANVYFCLHQDELLCAFTHWLLGATAFSVYFYIKKQEIIPCKN
jgi:hypothetical protein